MRDALIRAAERGAHVAVTLQADPYRNPDGKRDNREAARLLSTAGAEVTLLPSTRAPFHLKAAVCDGVAYLDDRNWTARGPEMVIADDDRPTCPWCGMPYTTCEPAPTSPRDA